MSRKYDLDATDIPYCVPADPLEVMCVKRLSPPRIVPTYRNFRCAARKRGLSPGALAERFDREQPYQTRLKRATELLGNVHPGGNRAHDNDHIPDRVVAELYSRWMFPVESEGRQCDACGTRIHGRSDRRYCNDTCRKRASRTAARDRVPDPGTRPPKRANDAGLKRTGSPKTTDPTKERNNES